MSSDINVQTFSGKVNINNNLLVGSSHLYVDTAGNKVGITTASPDAGLHVNSNAYVNTDFRVGTSIIMNDTAGQITAGSFVGDGSAMTGINSDSGSWVNGTGNVYLSTTTDKVGIGTSDPTKKIHIVDTTNTATGILIENTDNGIEARPHIEMKNDTGSAYIQFNGSGRTYSNQLGILNNHGDTIITGSNCVAYDNVYYYARARTTADGGNDNFHNTGGATYIDINERSNGDLSSYDSGRKILVSSKYAAGVYMVWCTVSIKTDGTRDRGYSVQLVKNSTIFASMRDNIDHYQSSTYNQCVVSGIIDLANGDVVFHQTVSKSNFAVHRPDTRFYMFRISR